MLFFESYNGNKYVYLDTIGLVFPAEYAELVAQNSETSAACEVLAMDKEYLTKWQALKVEDLLQKSDFAMKELTPEELEEIILRSGLEQLTIEVTEDCNLRCKYCIYSDHYTDRRTFAHRHAEWPNVKKAIDRFAALLEKAYKKNPNLTPAVGFYGGEPLLNFPVIKQSVEYFKELNIPVKPTYHMTTNGTLLTDEHILFLAENNFTISISLDGPEEVHDRNRVTVGGQGTFKKIEETYHRIKTIAKDLKVNTMSVYDWRTDFFKAHEFFNNSGFPVPSRISPVTDSSDSTYYDQFTEEERTEFLERYKQAKAEYIKEAVKGIPEDQRSYLHSFLGTPQSVFLELAGVLTPPNPIFPVPGTCFPGRKIYVNVDGDFHVCERVAFSFPIGDVEAGLDFKRGAELVKNYQQSILADCVKSDCPIKKVCSGCYSTFMHEGKFAKDEQWCSWKIRSVKQQLEFAVTIGEGNPEFFDVPRFRYYHSLKKYLGRD